MQYSCSFLRPNYVNAVFHAIIPFKLGNIFFTSIKKPARPAKLGNIIVSGIKKAGYTSLVKQLSLRTCTHNYQTNWHRYRYKFQTLNGKLCHQKSSSPSARAYDS